MTRYHHQRNNDVLDSMLAMSSRRQRGGVAGIIGMLTTVIGATTLAYGLGALLGL